MKFKHFYHSLEKDSFLFQETWSRTVTGMLILLVSWHIKHLTCGFILQMLLFFSMRCPMNWIGSHYRQILKTKNSHSDGSRWDIRSLTSKTKNSLPNPCDQYQYRYRMITIILDWYWYWHLKTLIGTSQVKPINQLHKYSRDRKTPK